MLQTLKITRYFSALLLAFSLTSASDVQAAGPLHYLKPGQPDSEAILPPPPLPGSTEQSADMASVVAQVHAATSNEAAVAFSEKKFNLYNFTPAVGDFLKPGAVPITEALFVHIKSDAAAVTDIAKDYWKRPRPFTTDTNLASGTLEKSFSYPSGHSTEATVMAIILADLFPDKRDAILAIGRDIGWHRVQIARHYPSDIYAGRTFAKAIVQELKSSASFQADFAAAQAEIASLKPPL